MKKMKFAFCFLSMFLVLFFVKLNAQVEVSPFLTNVINENDAYPHINKSVTTPATMTFAQAVASCRNLKYNGDSSWYLPTAEELLLFSRAASDGTNRLVACLTQTQRYTDAFYNNRGDTASGDDMCWAYKGTVASLTRSPASPTNAYVRYPTYKVGTVVGTGLGADIDATLSTMPQRFPTDATSGVPVIYRAVGPVGWSHVWPFKYNASSGLDSLYQGLAITSSRFDSIPDFHATFYTLMPINHMLRVRNMTSYFQINQNQTWANTHLQNMNANYTDKLNAGWTTTPFPIYLRGSGTSTTGVNSGGEAGETTPYTDNSRRSTFGYPYGETDEFYSGPYSYAPGLTQAYQGIVICFSCGYPGPSSTGGFRTFLSRDNVDMSTATAASGGELINAYAINYSRSILHTIAIGTAFDLYKNAPTFLLGNLAGMTNFVIHQPAQNQRNGVHCVR